MGFVSEASGMALLAIEHAESASFGLETFEIQAAPDSHEQEPPMIKITKSYNQFEVLVVVTGFV